jgi:hypothetical protein
MASATAALALVLLGAQLGAQSQERNEMSVPPSTIFKGMLRFAAEGEPEKMRRSLDLLKPVLEEHETTFGRAAANTLIGRLRSSEPQTAVAAARLLIARDVVLLLRAVPAAPLDRARTLSRTAALEWRILADESVTRNDPAAARTIETDFKDLFQTVEARDKGRASEIAARVEKGVLGLTQ